MHFLKYVAGDSVAREKTSWGMDCIFYPKRQFGEKMAMLVVPFGANATGLKSEQNTVTFPKGIAHFIEHKLFQQKWGDAFIQFGKQGASANAFTDGEKTVYYFVCRERFDENLKLLLDFVQHPVFAEKDVEREKEIICSEIAMYDDDPGWAVYYQMMEQMYPDHPIHTPIAGTEKSVRETKAADLKMVYEAAYLPQKFCLVCSGNIQPRKIMALAEQVQPKKEMGQIQWQNAENQNVKLRAMRDMDLKRPLFQMGIPLQIEQTFDLRQKIAFEILLDIWAGESSLFYEQAYQKKWLDTPLGSRYLQGRGYAFCAFFGSGKHGDAIKEALQNRMKDMKQNGIADNDFERIQKKYIGQVLRTFQSVSDLCMAQAEICQYQSDLSDLFRMSKDLHKTDVEKLLQNMPVEDKMVLSIIK